jgi:YggT family protein
MTRSDVAEYVGAVFGVYALIVIAWVVLQFVFQLGVRPPYSRVSNAVLDFLRDCTEPYLRIFRRLGLRVGPLDLSPMVAIIVLQVAGALVVGAIEPG